MRLFVECEPLQAAAVVTAGQIVAFGIERTIGLEEGLFLTELTFVNVLTFEAVSSVARLTFALIAADSIVTNTAFRRTPFPNICFRFKKRLVNVYSSILSTFVNV